MKEKPFDRQFDKLWEPLIFRPKLPKGWSVLQQIDSIDNSYISFIRWGKVHHRGDPQMIFVVFSEYNPEKESLIYRVRGGRKVQPEETLKKFKSLKDATDYLIFLMKSTDTWLEEINSPEYIEAYDKKIEKLIKNPPIED